MRSPLPVVDVTFPVEHGVHPRRLRFGYGQAIHPASPHGCGLPHDLPSSGFCVTRSREVVPPTTHPGDAHITFPVTAQAGPSLPSPRPPYIDTTPAVVCSRYGSQPPTPDITAGVCWTFPLTPDRTVGVVLFSDITEGTHLLLFTTHYTTLPTGLLPGPHTGQTDYRAPFTCPVGYHPPPALPHVTGWYDPTARSYLGCLQYCTDHYLTLLGVWFHAPAVTVGLPHLGSHGFLPTIPYPICWDGLPDIYTLPSR